MAYSFGLFPDNDYHRYLFSDALLMPARPRVAAYLDFDGDDAWFSPVSTMPRPLWGGSAAGMCDPMDCGSVCAACRRPAATRRALLQRRATAPRAMPRSDEEAVQRLKPTPAPTTATPTTTMTATPTTTPTTTTTTQTPLSTLYQVPQMTVTESEDGARVQLTVGPLAATARDQLNVELLPTGVLMISGSAASADGRLRSTWSRSVAVPKHVSEADVTATFRDGQLVVTFPKPVEPAVARIAIRDSSSNEAAGVDAAAATTTTTTTTTTTPDAATATAAATTASTEDAMATESTTTTSDRKSVV